MNTIPKAADRDRNADLLVLARKVVKERLSFNESETLTAHTVEHPDLLPYFVTEAIGVKFALNYATATDEDCREASAWGDYCCKLFDDVEEFVMGKLS